jgi:hypothetical protein
VKIQPYHPIARRALKRCGISNAVADSVRQRELIRATLTHAALGQRPDPAWHVEWAVLLARRVRATEG